MGLLGRGRRKDAGNAEDIRLLTMALRYEVLGTATSYSSRGHSKRDELTPGWRAWIGYTRAIEPSTSLMRVREGGLPAKPTTATKRRRGIEPLPRRVTDRKEDYD